MQRLFDQFALILTTAWVGALWAIGFLAVQVLFRNLDHAIAGTLAGQMFTLLSYFGIVSAFILMIHRVSSFGVEALKQAYFWILVAMLALILAGQFGIQPILAHLKSQAGAVDVMQSVFADRFKHWHGIASIAYLVECILGGALVLKAKAV
ncbi:MAG TPA: DUF4149 domain-containing protein [Methylophilaceae bacterium]